MVSNDWCASSYRCRKWSSTPRSNKPEP
jgi:hypothetical protein